MRLLSYAGQPVGVRLRRSPHSFRYVVTAIASGAVFAREVFLGLHLDEAARGALELEAEALAAVEGIGGRGGGDDQVDVVVVELVDQRDEAAGGILARGR